MRKVAIAVVLCMACAFAWLSIARAQRRAQPSPWVTGGADVQHTGWQKTEDRITVDNAKNIQMLWKLKLAGGTDALRVPTEPLFAGRVITEGGFKDLAIVMAPGDNLYAVDFELGQVLWHKHFDVQQSAAQVGACPGGHFTVAMIQPPPAFRFRGRGAAGRGRGPAPSRGPTPPAPAAGPRRVGAASGGGFFGLRGVYVLTSDGYLHEQILTNGDDYAPAVKFLPYRNANVSDLTMQGSTMYVSTSGGCGGSMKVGGIWTPAPGGTFALDMSTPDYKLASYDTHSVKATGLDGAAQSTDGKTLYVTTGSGTAGVTGAVYPNSVVALDAATMQVKDYYTPSGSEATAKTNINVSPVVFAYKGHDVVAAYGAGGRLVLLNGASLGGANHHTPLAISAALSSNGGSGSWGRLAMAQDKSNAPWIFVSVNGPLSSGVHFATMHGAAANGSVVAFKVEDQGGKTVLTPEWASANMANPSPAATANGLVFTLANGGNGTNARLYALNATTGATEYTSGSGIASPGYFSSLSVSLGHVMFVTEDDTLYSFGIGIEH